MYSIGIDWATDHHDISTLDTKGKEIQRFRISHDSEGLGQLLRKVKTLKCSRSKISFCIERNQGLLIDFLLSHGYFVYPINPKSAERFRDRHKTSRKKDDGFDAFCLADALRTDGHRWKPIVPDSELARELKVLVQDREKLIRTKTKVANQLTSCLHEYYPLALEIFSEIQGKISLEFLKAYPSSEAVRKMTFKEFKRFMNQHHYPWSLTKKTPKSFFEEIQSSKLFLDVDSVMVKTKSRLLLALVEQLKTLIKQVKQYDKEIERLMAQHPDNDIFTSLPGAGTTLGSQLAAHFGQDRSRFSRFESVQQLSGTAPITKSSGKKSGKLKKVQMRYACQHSFRNTLTQFAFSSLTKSVWSKHYYDQKRKTGLTHAGALRTLANKWTKIIFTMWKRKVCYQEAIFLASRQQHSLLNAS